MNVELVTVVLHSFSGNIYFKFSVLFLCYVYPLSNGQLLSRLSSLESIPIPIAWLRFDPRWITKSVFLLNPRMLYYKCSKKTLNFIVQSTCGIFCILIFLSNSSETRNSNGPSNSRSTSNRREEIIRGGTQATSKTLAGYFLQKLWKIRKSPH
jgi:hypothetical protein